MVWMFKISNFKTGLSLFVLALGDLVTMSKENFLSKFTLKLFRKQVGQL